MSIILLVVLSGCWGPKTDAEMQRHYESKKASFSALVEGTACHIERDRILWRLELIKSDAACLELLDELGADGVGIDRLSEGVIVYPRDGHYSSHRKAYLFSEKELTPLYSSFDTPMNDLKPYEQRFKKIDEKWYITYEYVN
ncbi:MAG: hypothetical protein EKK49_02030 [Rhodocyclaceae bacterium]|nr:MAG: hypothetical protein EKK49_02030 [Rhodocyclaceae bacterium]